MALLLLLLGSLLMSLANPRRSSFLLLLFQGQIGEKLAISKTRFPLKLKGHPSHTLKIKQFEILLKDQRENYKE